MAAEAISAGGATVDLYDAMPSVGRKLLIAGKGGLNLTHSEPAATFRSRYGSRQEQLTPLLDAFGPPALREWAQGLGVETFVGSSGRVFPTDMKAAPLLRAWLQRLRAAGVVFHMRHRWCGWTRSSAGRTRLDYATPDGEQQREATAVVLALGGGSWAKLGSDGRWCALLERAGIPVTPLRPANCGFDVGWSQYLSERFAGAPIKPVVASFVDSAGVLHRRQGEFVLTVTGLEGSLIYALSAVLRDEIASRGSATLRLDLLPGHDLARVVSELARPRGARSLTSHLQSRLQLKGAKVALLHECISAERLRPSRVPRRGHQVLAGSPDRTATAGRGDQQRRRRVLRSAGRTTDAAASPGRVLRRRNARLGSADRRLSPQRVSCQRPRGRPWRTGVAQRSIQKR
jgi:uncharacterized flavoprotein (TIGR03862 family)